MNYTQDIFETILDDTQLNNFNYHLKEWNRKQTVFDKLEAERDSKTHNVYEELYKWYNEQLATISADMIQHWQYIA